MLEKLQANSLEIENQYIEIKNAIRKAALEALGVQKRHDS